MRQGVGPGAGQLLIATQPGRGGYFDQSVVLILEHSDNGTLGVCLHQPTELEMLPGLEGLTEMLSPPARIFEGGPVNQQSGVCLAQLANPAAEPLGWIPIFDDVGVFDLDTPLELVAGAFSHVRVFVGLAGWEPQQLEGELIRGSWFRTRARAEEVFGTPEDLWRRILRRMGGEVGQWSTWTPSPALN